ncbi:hypothetical protein EJC51_08980 [Streptomyces aquilus]|uniref:FtsH ternary system domain-containing protein n=1 Tax=Streptomyces aquilus TaxID=2548456 RepID=A0A3Q9BWF5_9ACTN|nr:hypothetical protein [Streptomyces aquilus]AZP16235.1 hypothetical protein EJC51_08980 [Streptomyces aquilus]
MERGESPLRRLLNRIAPEAAGPTGTPPTPIVARPAPRGAPPPTPQTPPAHPPPRPPRQASGAHDHGVRFSVRPARPPEEDPPAPAPPVSYTSSPTVDWRVAARFSSPHRVLGALEALHRAGAAEWSCHAEPGGGAVWLLSGIGPTVGAELLTLHGGAPHAILGHGALAGERGGGPDQLSEVLSWPGLDLVDLVARVPLTSPARAGHRTLLVLTAAQLLSSVARQALAFGVEVSTLVVRARPWDSPDSPQRELTAFALSAPDAIPHALVVALSALPRTAVCRPVTGCERLLLDVRLCPPLDDALLYSRVPDGELWLVGDREEWPPLRLEPLGAPSPVPTELVGVAAEPPPAASALPDAARVPSTQVRVVSDAHADTAVDAVLLHDDELPLLRRYLPGRPLGEAGFLLPGPGRHLLLEPVGLARDLPFGVPLLRIGPGSLFLESGHSLTPPLPPAARAHLFGLDGSSAVVCWHGGRHRFPLAPMVPLWTLWAPPDPVEVSSGLSKAGRELLDALDALATASGTPHGPLPTAHHDPAEALERATRLRATGDHEAAAEAYRSAGDHLEAARLFEQAALEGTEER